MKIKTGLVILVSLSLIAFAGCTNPQNDSEKESEALVLRSYEVPERLAKEVSGTISTLLGTSAGTIGRARIAPDGQLLVAAPKSFHDGVKDFIERLQNANPEPPPSTEVNYWIVAGRESKTPAKLDEFRIIKPALETIQNNQGNMEFKLLDHVVVTSSSQNTKSEISGDFIEIDQTVSSLSSDSLNIILRIKMRKVRISSTIETDLETKHGELVVLGQVRQGFLGISIFNPIKDEEERGKHIELVNVYYIISATVKK